MNQVWGLHGKGCLSKSDALNGESMLKSTTQRGSRKKYEKIHQGISPVKETRRKQMSYSLKDKMLLSIPYKIPCSMYNALKSE